MKQCTFCGYPSCMVKKNVVSPHNLLSYSLYHCPGCDSCFFDLHEHTADLKDLYEEVSQTRGSFPEIFTPKKTWKQQVSLLSGLLGRTPETILDIGCRTGDFLLHFPDNVSKEGIEVSAHFAGIARKRGIFVHHGFVEKTDFAHSYDLVTCYAIMEHLENPMALLERMPEIVNPKGVLGVLVPTRQSLKRALLELFHVPWHMDTPPEHLNFFSRKFLDQYLEKKGFRLIHRYYSSGGMVHLFEKFRILNKIIALLTEVSEDIFLKSIPVFDHMYSYYRNTGIRKESDKNE